MALHLNIMSSHAFLFSTIEVLSENSENLSGQMGSGFRTAEKVDELNLITIRIYMTLRACPVAITVRSSRYDPP